jgi:hypothetical protein
VIDLVDQSISVTLSNPDSLSEAKERSSGLPTALSLDVLHNKWASVKLSQTVPISATITCVDNVLHVK